MEKERRVKVLVIVTLLIAVIGLSVAFAALSQTLTINGSAYLNATKWGIKFENLSSPIKVGDASVTGEAKINESTYVEITDMNVNLKTPGDSVTYNVDLVNEGTINAKIEKIEKTQLTEEQAKYLSFKVLKENNEELNEGYILGKETRIPLTIKIEFKKDITKEDLPKEISEITLSYRINFVQTDEKIVTTEQGSSSACTTFEKKSAYNVGDEIALCNNDTGKSEDFYVISDNGDTVTALAKYNLLVGTYMQFNLETGENEYIPLSETEENYGLQSERAKGTDDDSAPESIFEGLNCESTESEDFPMCVERVQNYYKNLISIKFAANNVTEGGYWVDSNLNLLSKYGTEYPAWVFDENSLLYEPLKNYESYLTSIGKTSVNASLLSIEQAANLGCDKDNKTCEAAPSWVYSTYYWLGCAANVFDAYNVTSYGQLHNYVNAGQLTGLRPVITISKTDL